MESAAALSNHSCFLCTTISPFASKSIWQKENYQTASIRLFIKKLLYTHTKAQRNNGKWGNPHVTLTQLLPGPSQGRSEPRQGSPPQTWRAKRHNGRWGNRNYGCREMEPQTALGGAGAGSWVWCFWRWVTRSGAGSPDRPRRVAYGSAYGWDCSTQARTSGDCTWFTRGCSGEEPKAERGRDQGGLWSKKGGKIEG